MQFFTDLEKTNFKIEAIQVLISEARETRAKAQAFLKASQAKYEESLKRRVELILQKGQLQQERMVRTRAIEEARA